MRKVIRGGTVVTAADAVQADVLIEDERIAAVGSFPDVDAEPIDATGCYVLPGCIDNHTHLSMPFGGTWSIDDYDSGTQAAAAGGTTCIVDFALQMHPEGLRSSLEEWQGRAEGQAHVDYGFHMAITSADEPTIRDMAAMVDEGVVTFKVFLAYKDVLMVTDDQYVRVLQRTRETGGLVMVHAENGWVIDLLVRESLAAGRTAPIDHALTRPKVLEVEATDRAVRFAEHAGAPVFIVHVTCREAAAAIIAARARGVPAYGETCLQYLLLTDDDLRRPGFEGARYVCSPPLRTPDDQAALWDALAYDHLQIVSTDHCPFSDEQKRLGIDDF
jgi:dihydropyrimidinase